MLWKEAESSAGLAESIFPQEKFKPLCWSSSTAMFMIPGSSHRWSLRSPRVCRIEQAELLLGLLRPVLAQSLHLRVSPTRYLLLFWPQALYSATAAIPPVTGLGTHSKQEDHKLTILQLPVSKDKYTSCLCLPLDAFLLFKTAFYKYLVCILAVLPMTGLI